MESRAQIPETPESLLSLLKQGSLVWNEFRTRNPQVSINLQDVHLQKLQLPGINLSGANLSGSDLRGANLQGACLRRANLELAKLSGTMLVDANLENANLRGGLLIRTQLNDANLKKAILTNANLSYADLTGAQLSEADLSKARLSESRLKDACGIVFDENEVRGTRYTARHLRFDKNGIRTRKLFSFTLADTDDPWSFLRRNYNGINLLLTLLALLIFLLPRILLCVGLLLLSEIDSVAHRAIVEALESSKPLVYWRIVFGLGDRGLRDVLWALVVVLLFFYNLGRIFVTCRVGALRDLESRSSVTPSYSDYGYLYKIHRILSPFGVIALISSFLSVMHFVKWLFTFRIPL